MGTQIVIAIFDDPEDAQRALRTLKEDGFDAKDITIVDPCEAEDYDAELTPARSPEERILDADVVLTLHTNREGAERAETALSRHGAREIYRAS